MDTPRLDCLRGARRRPAAGRRGGGRSACAIGACAVLGLFGLLACDAASAGDPRLREVRYDAHRVITVPVRAGVVTDVVLGSDESIGEVASGQSAECSRPQARWCIAAAPGGHHLFVQPRSGASGSNNVAVVTDARIHSFRFVVQSEHDPAAPCYRITVREPEPVARDPDPAAAALRATAPGRADPLLQRRLHEAPRVVNTEYSFVPGDRSEDIVPTLVFDDGRFTYFQFASQAELPAVFEVRSDASPTLLNLRMQDDLLVADRVARRFVLRAGSAQVGIWNDAYGAGGVAPADPTTMPGVTRVLKSELATPARPVADRRTP